MYSAEEHRMLTHKLLNDKILNKIEDRFERMHHLMKERADYLKKYGEWVLERCEAYEREHRKSSPMADYYASRAETWFCRFAEMSEKVTIDPEKAYKELIRVSNKALRFMPLDWANYPLMARLAELYATRASVEYGRGEHQLALSNLRHAFAVVQHYEKDQVKEHFNFRILTKMVTLGLKLVDRLQIEGQEQLVSYFKEKSTIKMGKAIEVIDQLSSAFKEYKANHNTSEFSDNFNLSSKLRLVRGEFGGRCYQATAHILPDEYVLHDRAQSVAIFDEHRFNYCNFCHRPMDTFWPCPGCSELGYCSADCAETAYQQYHRLECGIYGLLLGAEDFYWMSHVFRHYTIFGVDLATRCENQESAVEYGGEPFDLNEFLQSKELRTKSFSDLSPDGRELLCRSFTSLESNRGKRSPIREHAYTVMAVAMVHFFIYKGFLSKEVLEDQLTYSQLVENLAANMSRVCTNGFCWTEERNDKSSDFTRVASCCVVSASFLNHSCDPNIGWAISENGLITMKASRAILPGEMLTTCYGPKKSTNFVDRQQRLINDYCFHCTCEVCMKDASNLPNALCCTNGTCRGPVVPQESINACLKCSQEASNKQSASMLKEAEKASIEFFRLIRKLYKKPSRVGFIAKLNCIKGWRTRKSEALPEFLESDELISRRLQEITVASGDDTSLRTTLNSAYFNLSRVDALEKQLYICSELIYQSSYRLLEMYVLMLKVYHDSNLTDRGLLLIEPLSRCLEHITPSLTDSSVGKLLFVLDYAAYFYESYAIAHDNDIPCLVELQMDSEEIPLAQSKMKMNSQFWSFSQQLNTKLAAILQYDIEQRGHFFPVAHRRLCASLKGKEDDCQKAEADKEEQYASKLFSECHRRLGLIETVVDGL